MIKLRPILTEKTLEEAKKGKYTFFVAVNLTKSQIKKKIGDTFDVQVARVRTMNLKRVVKKNVKGKKKTSKAKKKAIVTLKGKGKIDLFDTKK